LRRAGVAVAILTVLTVTTFGVGQALSFESSVPVKGVIDGWNTFQQTPLNLVINDATTWARVWNVSFCPDACTYVSLPRIDFSNTTVLAVFAGPPLDPGVIISPLVSRTLLSLLVESTVTISGRGCVYYGPMYVPGEGVKVTIVSIQKTTLPVTFATRTIVKDCRI